MAESEKCNILETPFSLFLKLVFSFEEVNAELLACKKGSNQLCMGGYARVVATVKKLQKSRTNPIFLNAGDNFSGSIWYTVGRWSVISYFLNLLPADVMVCLINLEYLRIKCEQVIFFVSCTDYWQS